MPKSENLFAIGSFMFRLIIPEKVKNAFIWKQVQEILVSMMNAVFR